MVSTQDKTNALLISIIMENEKNSIQIDVKQKQDKQ